jgi:hypothetical protein
MRLVGWTIVAAAAGLSACAEAQMVRASDPRTLVAALEAKGYQAELDNSAQAPSIKSEASGIKFRIYFENCESGKACMTVTFFTGFNDIKASPTKVNKWNLQKRFARAYIDRENDPVLAMDLDLDHEGIPQANFNEYLDVWASLVPAYLDFLKKR